MLQCHVIVTSDTNARCYASQRGKLQAIALPLLCHKLWRTICPRQFSQSRSKITFQIWGENYVPSFWIFTKKTAPYVRLMKYLKKILSIGWQRFQIRLITGGSKLTDWTLLTSEIPTESDTRPEFLLKTVKPNQHFIISTSAATKFFKLQPFQIFSDFYFTIYNIKLIRNFIEPEHHLPSWSSWPSSVCLPTYISVLVKQKQTWLQTKNLPILTFIVYRNNIHMYTLWTPLHAMYRYLQRQTQTGVKLQETDPNQSNPASAHPAATLDMVRDGKILCHPQWGSPAWGLGSSHWRTTI